MSCPADRETHHRTRSPRRGAGRRAARAIRPRGFTLTELAVVVSIIAVLSAIALPRFANASVERRLEAVTRRVVLDLGLAQRHARLSSASQTVVFLAATNSYTLPGVADFDRALNTYAVNLARPPYEAALVSASFGGQPQLVFDGYGTPANGVGGSIILRVGVRQKTITVDGATGAVSVADGGIVAATKTVIETPVGGELPPAPRP
jgi:type IV fimbrial biogenesis protein FimT